MEQGFSSHDADFGDIPEKPGESVNVFLELGQIRVAFGSDGTVMKTPLAVHVAVVGKVELHIRQLCPDEGAEELVKGPLYDFRKEAIRDCGVHIDKINERVGRSTILGRGSFRVACLWFECEAKDQESLLQPWSRGITVQLPVGAEAGGNGRRRRFRGLQPSGTNRRPDASTRGWRFHPM